jgi:hypothetical protein
MMRKSPLLVSILAALSGCSSTHQGEGCLMREPALECPASSTLQPSQLFLNNECGEDLEIDEILSEGTHKVVGEATDPESEPNACCYDVLVVDHSPSSQCSVGRPYFEDGELRRAPLERRAIRSVNDGRASDPSRAAAWAAAGSDEHASIAAFSRLALQLLAHGAPSELLRAVHQAAIDEVAHAERCWALARHFGEAIVSAGAFPFREAVAVDVTLAALAADAVREGCLGETLGAHLTAVAAELATEPEVRAELGAIARDEAEHAVLSYRIVAWALRVGGADVRAAVVGAFAEPWPRLDVEELALRASVDVALLRRAADAGVAEVLEPAKARLLAA